MGVGVGSGWERKPTRKEKPSQKETDVTEKGNLPLNHIVHGQVRQVAHDVVDHQKARLRSEIRETDCNYCFTSHLCMPLPQWWPELEQHGQVQYNVTCLGKWLRQRDQAEALSKDDDCNFFITRSFWIHPASTQNVSQNGSISVIKLKLCEKMTVISILLGAFGCILHPLEMCLINGQIYR